MGAVTQLVGALLALAGVTWATGSPWPLIVGGVALIVAAEMPRAVEAVSRRRQMRALRRRIEQQQGGSPMVLS